MRVASFNVLADAYTGYGDYSHADPTLMQPGARTEGIVRAVRRLNADIIGIQEAEQLLIDAFDNTGEWQTLWSPKGRNKPDGCLTLVREGTAIADFETHHYDDSSGHVMQPIKVGRVTLANTHIKWAPIDAADHIGVSQTAELLHLLKNEERAVIMADCNDRPGGPVRRQVAEAGFINILDKEPTAIVNQELASLDLLVVRGMAARNLTRRYDIAQIPNQTCPSDHIPLLAEVDA